MSTEQEVWDTCLRLRQLEEQISRQRRFIANLKAQNLDAEGERKRLSVLLAQLDALLRSDEMSRAA